jgi:rod shape-determining protein MreB
MLNITDTSSNVQNNESDALFVGFDLGTSQSAIATSNGKLMNIASVVGYPKDFISFKLLNKKVVFGDECINNRMSVDMEFPLKNGVIVKGESGNEQVARELIKYLLSRIDNKISQKIYLVVGSPAQASLEDRQAIMDSVKGLVESVVVVSEPFLVSYGLGVFGFALIVDIGAGTLDLCRMHGTIPGNDDQKTLFKSGNYIDQQLLDSLSKKFPNARVTIDIARKIKEEYAFIGAPGKPVKYDFHEKDTTVKHDITEEVNEASKSILPDMFKQTRELIESFDPEYQQALLENIILAGCGSGISGIATAFESELSNLGKAKVRIVEDPVYAGAIGGLNLAQDMPLDEWNRV